MSLVSVYYGAIICQSGMSLKRLLMLALSAVFSLR